MPPQFPPPADDRSPHPDRPKPDRPDSDYSTHSNQPEHAEAIDFEKSLQDVEQAFLLLKARYAQIQADQHRQQELQHHKQQIERQLQSPRSRAIETELKQELKKIRQQLEELEVALESQIFSWSGLKEVFWQAVRFGGLGIVIGWILKSVVG